MLRLIYTETGVVTEGAMVVGGEMVSMDLRVDPVILDAAVSHHLRLAFAPAALRLIHQYI
ncbi:hypothetical protein [Nitrosospira sp. Nsp14]|uniref:hypothetical protein n=1 Tax=Nitrosospira sp. Nsp14 TaxID=1855333 RepID=UPI0015A51A74|nr:hypothetical protein [Nitrosospira sp. Nsp14]